MGCYIYIHTTGLACNFSEDITIKADGARIGMKEGNQIGCVKLEITIIGSWFGYPTNILNIHRIPQKEDAGRLCMVLSHYCQYDKQDTIGCWEISNDSWPPRLSVWHPRGRTVPDVNCSIIIFPCPSLSAPCIRSLSLGFFGTISRRGERVQINYRASSVLLLRSDIGIARALLAAVITTTSAPSTNCSSAIFRIRLLELLDVVI